MVSLFIRVFFSVGLFAAAHSILASRAAKAAAARLVGQRQRSGLYRVFFNAQSFVTAGALLAYLLRLPDRPLYHLRGPLAGLMRLGQAGGLVFAFLAARRVGLGGITGLRSLAEWLAGKEVIRDEPEAQGPAPISEEGGPLDGGGPFRYSRHPLNLSPLPVFWLTPRMTAKRLAFNLAATAYLVLGSLHEEARLLQAYGDDYREYQQSGVPFYLPRLW